MLFIYVYVYEDEKNILSLLEYWVCSSNANQVSVKSLILVYNIVHIRTTFSHVIYNMYVYLYNLSTCRRYRFAFVCDSVQHESPVCDSTNKENQHRERESFVIYKYMCRQIIN